MNDLTAAVVIDNGTRTCKIGMAGDDAPRALLPSVVGYPQQIQINEFVQDLNYYIGNDINFSQHKLSFPIERGFINNWEEMEKLWNAVYDKILKIHSNEHLLLMTYNPLSPKQNRRSMTEILFENFHVPGLYLAIPSILCMYSCGKQTGLIVDCGEGATYVMPVYEGYIVSSAIKRIPIAGMDITHQLMLAIEKEKYELPSSNIYELCTNIKENVCYIVEDYAKEFTKEENEIERIYEFQNHYKITLNVERFMSTECLFYPRLIGLEFEGVSATAFRSISGSDIDLRMHLYNNIILTGGTSLIPGFVQRMRNDIQKLSSNNSDVKVNLAPNSIIAPWIGGSILGTKEEFPAMCINKQDYEEFGVDIVFKQWI